VVGDAEFVVGMARPGTFQKGHPRLGGRKKGVPGKRNSRYAEYVKQQQREQEILEAKQAFQDALAGVTNFSPLQVMHAVMLLRISKGDAAGALGQAYHGAAIDRLGGAAQPHHRQSRQRLHLTRPVGESMRSPGFLACYTGLAVIY